MYGPWTARITRNLLEIQNLGPAPDFLNQYLCCNKIVDDLHAH